jgi:multiple sugar transport system ATP-binding protein
MAKVTLENVVKKFGNVVAADHLNLCVRDKEFYVILGPSGGGKSTILNLVAGLEQPSEGHIYFDDENVDQLPPEKRDVAMVFQTFALYPHMNAFENIAFSLRLRKVPRDEIRRRIDDVVAKFGIRDLMDRKPHEMSGGERQRVALARAAVREPRVFLLDEPLSNVDAKLRLSLRADIIRLQRALGITAIYVTHDQVEAMTMAHRIGVVHDGKLVEEGEPLELFNAPRTLFAAGFVGTPPVNTFDCRLNESAGILVPDLAGDSGFSLKISPAMVGAIKKSGSSSLLFAVRPQHMRVHAEKLSTDEAEAEVYSVEPLGTETIVDLNFGGKIIKVMTDAVTDYRIGQTVWLSMDADKVLVFDRQTERRILP